MSDKILLLIGKSGSGKSTIQNRLSELYGLRPLLSYTTRKERADDTNNPTHIFINKDEYDCLTNKVATTYFDGAYYCATKEQIDNSDVYVVDYDGYIELCEQYKGNKTFVLVYVQVGLAERLNRMDNRGDSSENIKNRITNDNEKFNFPILDVVDDIVFNNNVGDIDCICDYLYNKYFK